MRAECGAERMQREDQSVRASRAVQLTVLPVFDCMDNRNCCSFIGVAPWSGFSGSALVLAHAVTHIAHAPTPWNKDVTIQTGHYISNYKRLVLVIAVDFTAVALGLYCLVWLALQVHKQKTVGWTQSLPTWLNVCCMLVASKLFSYFFVDPIISFTSVCAGLWLFCFGSVLLAAHPLRAICILD